MRLGTRLLWPLLSVVGVVMLLYSAYATARREQVLLADARRETEAYATALALGVEYAFTERDRPAVTRILERISREPRIYSAIVYDSLGRALEAAAPLTLADAVPPEQLRTLLQGTTPISFERVQRGERVHSVIRRLRDPERNLLGALEVVQPLAPIYAEVARSRVRALLATLTLGAGVAVMLLWLVRRVVARPLHELVVGARALGRGELTHRIAEKGASELTELSVEFNGMAAHLQSAREDLLRQTEQRIVLERDLRNAEKLAALGNLAAGVAHEIAAPLNVVAGRADMLRKRDKPAEARDRDLRIIIDQIGRITVIVRNLLDFARRREPRLQTTAVDTVLRGVLELLDGELERAQVQVSCSWPTDLHVRADAQLLHQVFVNLLLNAIHSVEQIDDTRCIQVSAFRSNGGARDPEVILEVVDNGAGLAAELGGRLFEPFVTTKPPGTGTGLGLAVVQRIVEEHGGTVQARDRSEAGERGALFRVVLPAAQDA